jgi:RNA polymerase sigma-70 factor, ECF subfamily
LGNSYVLLPWCALKHELLPDGETQSADGCRDVLRKEEITGLSGAASNVVSPDAVLVSAIRFGDEQAMAQLYERYSPVVYSVALRVLGNTAAAEDVLQDVFMQLWRSPEMFDASRGSLPGWLAVITRNRAIDSLRKRRPEADITEIVVSVEPDLASSAGWSRALEKIRSVLGGMPAPQRSALEMAFFDGLTHSEIAQKTGEPLGTVKTRIRAGLMTLRRAFNP